MVQVINTQHGPARVSVHACLWLLVATLFLGAPLPWRGWAAAKEEEMERAEVVEKLMNSRSQSSEGTALGKHQGRVPSPALL